MYSTYPSKQDVQVHQKSLTSILASTFPHPGGFLLFLLFFFFFRRKRKGPSDMLRYIFAPKKKTTITPTRLSLRWRYKVQTKSHGTKSGCRPPKSKKKAINSNQGLSYSAKKRLSVPSWTFEASLRLVDKGGIVRERRPSQMVVAFFNQSLTRLPSVRGCTRCLLAP
jgi:hypothetical protein